MCSRASDIITPKRLSPLAAHDPNNNSTNIYLADQLQRSAVWNPRPKAIKVGSPGSKWRSLGVLQAAVSRLSATESKQAGQKAEQPQQRDRRTIRLSLLYRSASLQSCSCSRMKNNTVTML